MNNQFNVDIEQHEKDLKYMQKCIKATNDIIIEAKTNQKSHLKRKEELEQSFKDRGVDPSNIDNEIISKYDKIEELKEKANSKIPFDLLRKLGQLPIRD